MISVCNNSNNSSNGQYERLIIGSLASLNAIIGVLSENLEITDNNFRYLIAILYEKKHDSYYINCKIVYSNIY